MSEQQNRDIYPSKILQAKYLCKSYGKKSVLQNLDLTITPGCIYGLIGRNGAGKTTLLGILSAQNTMDSGNVTYDGQAVWENRKALSDMCFAREISGVFFSGPNQLKVRHYLKTAEIFYPRWDAAYAERLLCEFDLEAKKKISQLSKGQMSMVSILIALASRAPLTILDEPVAGLDIVMRERFYQLLLEDYAATQRTFIISTHIIEEASSVFERVIILDEGKILENTSTDELIGQFHYVTGLDTAVDEVTRDLQVLSTQIMGRHKTVAVRGTPVSGNTDVGILPMNLQNIFVALCGHETQNSRAGK